MPKYQYFNNQQVLEPGAYTQVLGGDVQAPAGVNSGSVCIIDTGLGANFGGGSGSLGTKYSGKKAIYEFTQLDDFRNWIGGGVFWDIAKRLWKPSKTTNVPGIQQLFFISAKQTVGASFTANIGTVTGGSPNGGSLVFTAFAEGTVGNGVINSTSQELQSGYALKLITYPADNTKFQFQFFKGNYLGQDLNGADINNLTPVAAKGQLVFTSQPFNKLSDFVTYFNTNQDFEAAGFYLASSSISGLGSVTGTDVTNMSTYQLFAGGTETYNSNAVDEAVESVEELPNIYFLFDQYGVANAMGVQNTKIFTSMLTESTYERLAVIGGGEDRTESVQLSSSSSAIAAYYNSGRAFVVHGNILEKYTDGRSGFRELDSIYHAATVLGKMAGNPPQKPITWEALDIDGTPDILKRSERETLLKNGVMHLKEVGGNLVINQEITSLQKNDNYVYPDGDCPDGSLMRISAVLNATIKDNLEQRAVGSNQNLSDPSDIQSYVEKLLHDNTAQRNADSLIISYQDVSVTLTGTDYTIKYSFNPNGPINRLFVTGFMYSPNVTV